MPLDAPVMNTRLRTMPGTLEEARGISRTPVGARRHAVPGRGLGALVLALALAGGPPVARGDDLDRECIELPIVVVYLHHVQDQVLDYWVLPDDSPADHEVVVRLRLAENGALLEHQILSATHARLSRSVDLAVRGAAPFTPRPEGAECLIRRAIITTFRNPA